MTLLIGFLVLGLLITVHEFGHFIVAKLCGVGVIEFAVGFGRRLYSRLHGETRYSLRAFPLGGFVRMVGEDAGGFVEELEEERKKDVPPAEVFPEVQQNMLADKSRWFVDKPLWARAAIVFAGPLFNFILALVFAIFAIYIWGAAEPIDEPLIGDVSVGHPAEKAGLKPGDRILSINGVPLSDWKSMADIISGSDGQPMDLKIERRTDAAVSSLNINLTAEPESVEMKLLTGKEEKGKISYKIGIGPEARYEDVGLGKSIVYGSRQVLVISVMTLRSMWWMIKGAISPKHIAGPISIFQEAAKSAGRGAPHLISFIVLLSVSLAVLNLLPIPVLDGGHLLFMFFEFLLRRPLSQKVQLIANQAGMAALLMLMLFAVGNDIFRLVQ